MWVIGVAILMVVCIRIGIWMGERNRDAYERVLRAGDTVLVHMPFERAQAIHRVLSLDRTVEGHVVISWSVIRKVPAPDYDRLFLEE